MILLSAFAPGNATLESAYAADDEKSSCATVTTTATNTELKTYLENGTHILDAVASRSAKF